MPDVLDVNQAEQKIRTSVPDYTQFACHERVFSLFLFLFIDGKYLVTPGEERERL